MPKDKGHEESEERIKDEVEADREYYMECLIVEEGYPRRKAKRKAERLFKRKISEDE